MQTAEEKPLSRISVCALFEGNLAAKKGTSESVGSSTKFPQKKSVSGVVVAALLWSVRENA